MKRIAISILVACISVFANAQDDVNDIKANTTAVFHVYQGTNSIKQKQINAKQWIATTYGDYKSVLQFEDDENGKIIIKGISPLPREIGNMFSFTYHLFYTMTIDNKDDRFRIKMEDLKIEQYSPFVSGTLDFSVEECFGRRITSYDVKIERMQERLDAIQATDRTKLKKKELKALDKEEAKLKEDIARIEEALEETLEERAVFFATFKATIQGLFKSLSEAINENDDF